jgi:SAM-dependent MidA family methyltransferase
VEWRDSLQPFLGIHFSNELLDAMPVRLISGNMERLVDLENDKFVFVERPISQQATFQPPAQRDAFNQAALDWIDDVAAKLQRGYVVTFDYGRLEDEFPRDVQVRAQHRNLDSPFEQIGHADITMPVEWSTIIERAQANGLRVTGFTDQHHFLTGIISEFGRGSSPEPTAGYCGQSPLPEIGDSPKTKRALQTLLHPEMLGRAFQVIALEKNLDREAPRLAGFKFAH